MTIALIGLPWDAGSSHARGAALAPGLIRSVIFSDAASPSSFDGVDLADVISRYDFADLPEDGAACRAAIEARTRAAIDDGLKPLSLGGDHSVTYPILRAVRDAHGPVNILHIDAHPDTYADYGGDPYSHACPFARAVQAGCVNNLVQVGIRSWTVEQRAFGQRHDIVMLGAEDWNAIPYDRLGGPLYVSIDLDGLDPAFAPGVSHPEPGGLSTREVLSIIRKLDSSPVGADVVELNPEKDVGLATANVAARLVKELAGMMAA